MATRRLTAVLGGASLALAILLTTPALAEPAPQDQGAIVLSRGNVAGFGGFVSGIGEGLDSGPAFGASGAFFFTRNIGVEVGVQVQSLDFSGTSENELSGGTLDSTIVIAGVSARFPVGERASPYIAGGIAFFSTSYEIDSATLNSLADFNFLPIESVDSTVGFQFGGGVDVAVGRHIAVFGDLRFLTGTADTSAALRDTVSDITSFQEIGEQDLDRISLTAGVRVLF